MTANTAYEDVIVQSPTPLTVDFSFAAITPNTLAMRVAITAQLQQYFAEVATYETAISSDDYRCAIKSTFDGVQRQKLAAFSLITPVSDIAVGDNVMPQLGTVTFA